jgi:outer membrane protein assembly factor BamD (BamD/ComL family)
VQPKPQILDETPDLDKEIKRKLEQHYVKGLSAYWLKEWQEAAKHFKVILDTHPDYKEFPKSITRPNSKFE